MSVPTFLQAALVAGLFTQTTLAYTQVNLPSPFMHKNIDPIVFPGSYDKSHLHSFFGSDAVTANTNTTASLLTGCTNAENKNDLSVYWTPTLLYQASTNSPWTPVPLFRFSAYYSLGDTPAEIPFPPNLRLIAGNAAAQTAAATIPEAHSEWFCENGGSGNGPDKNGFPSGTCSTHLQQLLYFPNCVDPATLATAYKAGRPGAYRACPAGMKAMPQLRFSIRYDLRKVLPKGWSGTAPLQLACGNAYCSHGDFINGWTEEAGKELVKATAGKDKFTAVKGKLDGTAGCKPVDAEPEKGTGDFAKSVALKGKRSIPAVGWVSRTRFGR